jgi:hypothetical protein
MYHKREWLNPIGHHSFSAVEAFHGKRNQASISKDDDPEEHQALFIIHGCSDTVYLHDFDKGTEKLRILAKMATEFADYLDSLGGNIKCTKG